MEHVLLLALKGTTGDMLLYDQNLYEFKSRNRLWNTPHLGLLTVGAILAEKFHVTYLDLNFDTVKHYHYDYVFLSPTTSQAKQAYEQAAIFREHGVKVVLGGPHVTMVPGEALAFGDIVFVGESERTLRQFLRGEQKRLYEEWERPSMSLVNVPLYELCKKYPYSSIPVQLSRGCPHQCEFCLSSTIYGKYIRRKSLAQAYQELCAVKQHFEKKLVFFTDDNFLLDISYSLEILKMLKELKLQWYAFTDISIYKKKDLLEKLYSSGCRKLLIGFESLRESNLKVINKSGFKSAKVSHYEEAIHTIQSQKVGVIGSFVLGLEYDNDSIFDELYQFIYNTCIFGTNITVSTPFPGTKLYEKICSQQELSRDWSLYDGFTLLYDIPGIDKALFQKRYHQLIQKINSEDRIQRVMEYFKKVDKESREEPPV